MTDFRLIELDDSRRPNSQHEHNYFTIKSNIFNWFVNYFDRRWNNSNPSRVAETAAVCAVASRQTDLPDAGQL